MSLCDVIEDGEWNDWEVVESCVGVRNIGQSNYTCGAGRTLERRICQRFLGGKFCWDTKIGAEGIYDVMMRTVPCDDVPCPGKS